MSRFSKAGFSRTGTKTMRQRGRKTADNLIAVSVNGDPPRLQPPEHLDQEERTLFTEIAEACSPRHFVASDLPLLVSYVQATLLSRRAVKKAAEDPAMLALWEKATRMHASHLGNAAKAIATKQDRSENNRPPMAVRSAPTVGRGD
jgi:hypothetical protein